MRYAPKLVQRRSPVNIALSEKGRRSGAENPTKERVPLPKKIAARITSNPADEILFDMLLGGAWIRSRYLRS